MGIQNFIYFSNFAKEFNKGLVLNINTATSGAV
jgi:hypothetical protein